MCIKPDIPNDEYTDTNIINQIIFCAHNNNLEKDSLMDKELSLLSRNELLKQLDVLRQSEIKNMGAKASLLSQKNRSRKHYFNMV